jgi:hypothetical protein
MEFDFFLPMLLLLLLLLAISYLTHLLVRYTADRMRVKDRKKVIIITMRCLLMMMMKMNA